MATPRRNPDRRVADLVRALKLAKPAALRAVSPEGVETGVAMVGERGKYERAARTLIALGADVAHCLDSSGQVTESIAVGSTAPEDGDTQRRAEVRTRDQELAGLLRVVVDAQDKGMGRFTEILEAQRRMAEQLTNAAVGVMRAATDRASKLEGLVLRMTLTREQELLTREKELKKLAREVHALDVEHEEGSGEHEAPDPIMARIVEVAERAVGIPPKS